MKIKDFFRLLYLKLFRINDTPQKIALGLGLGVFSGILPGTGPLAALCLAFILRANRASALLGSLITNTWLSVVTFVLAAKAGAAIMGLNFFNLSIYQMILPLVIGYLVIAFCLGVLTYLVSLIIINNRKKSHVCL